MELNKLKLGTRLEFNLLTGTNTIKGSAYISQLLEVIDEQNIVIANPIANSRVVFIPPGFTIKVVLLDPKYGLLGFSGVVVKRDRRDNLDVLLIEVQGNIETIQRRNYFRLDCILNASYSICTSAPDPDDDQDPGREFKNAVTRNISGSGCCLIMEEELGTGKELEVRIKLDNSTEISAKGQIMRFSAVNSIKKGRYEAGIHFTEISRPSHKVLVRFIFDQQRVLLKKGLLDK